MNDLRTVRWSSESRDKRTRERPFSGSVVAGQRAATIFAEPTQESDQRLAVVEETFGVMNPSRIVSLIAASTWALTCQVVASELVANGSFEALRIHPDQSMSLDPWILPPGGNWGGVFEYIGNDPFPPFDGRNHLTFRGRLSQDLHTAPGQAYTLSLWISDQGVDGIHRSPSPFSVWWGSTLVATQYVNWSPWARLEYTVTADSVVTRLGFEVGGGFWGSLAIDAVSVAPVPEPGALGLFAVATIGLCFRGLFAKQPRRCSEREAAVQLSAGIERHRRLAPVAERSATRRHSTRHAEAYP